MHELALKSSFSEFLHNRFFLDKYVSRLAELTKLEYS